jgi:hypothetical protein
MFFRKQKGEYIMDFTEYAKQFNDNINKTENNLKKELFDVFLEKFNNGEMTTTDGLEGHQFFYNINEFIVNKDKKTSEKTKKMIEYFVDRIVVDIIAQSNRIDFMREIMEQSTKPNTNKRKLNLKKIDIDDLLNGNLDWSPRSTYYPDSCCLTCQNDGKSYIMIMDDWRIDFIDYKDFVYQNEKNRIKSFLYDKSPIESKINFKTKELVVFNFLPSAIDDYIFDNFSQSQYSFTGRNWNKFLCEAMACFNIFRTPTHVGGDILQDSNYLILGNYNDEKSVAPHIGSTINTVWQTLIAEKENVIKLIMMANGMNRDDAEEYFQNEIIEKQNAIITNIEPGEYNMYYIPEKSDMVNVYENIQMQGIEGVDIDMIITKESIKLSKELDLTTIINRDDINKVKEMVNNFSIDNNGLKLF